MAFSYHNLPILTTKFQFRTITTEMQLTVGPVRPRGRILEGPANDVFVSDLMTVNHFYCLGLSKNQISVGPGYLLDP
jgi:hypothetical protein